MNKFTKGITKSLSMSELELILAAKLAPNAIDGRVHLDFTIDCDCRCYCYSPEECGCSLECSCEPSSVEVFWQEALDNSCGHCGARGSDPCRTKSGNKTTPHRIRTRTK